MRNLRKFKLVIYLFDIILIFLAIKWHSKILTGVSILLTCIFLLIYFKSNKEKIDFTNIESILKFEKNIVLIFCLTPLIVAIDNNFQINLSYLSFLIIIILFFIQSRKLNIRCLKSTGYYIMYIIFILPCMTGFLVLITIAVLEILTNSNPLIYSNLVFYILTIICLSIKLSLDVYFCYSKSDFKKNNIIKVGLYFSAAFYATISYLGSLVPIVFSHYKLISEFVDIFIKFGTIPYLIAIVWAMFTVELKSKRIFDKDGT